MLAKISETKYISIVIGRYEEIDKIKVHKDKQTKLTISKNLFLICASLISIFKGSFKDFLNISSNNPKDTSPAHNVGRAIFDVYSKKLIPLLVARYIFVGFPIIKNIDQVFAETNSETK